MRAPVAVRARTVLRLFEDAGLWGGGPCRADAGPGGAPGMPGAAPCSAATPVAAGERGRPGRGVSAPAAVLQKRAQPCDIVDMDDLAWWCQSRRCWTT